LPAATGHEIISNRQARTAALVRRVVDTDRFKFMGLYLRVGALRSNQLVALKPIAEWEWELHYGPLLLAHVLRRNAELRIEPLN